MHLQDFYSKQLELPEVLIIDTTNPVRRLRSVLGDNMDYLLSIIFTAIGDKLLSNNRVSRAAERLFRDMVDAGIDRTQIFEHLITFEQCALDIRDKLEQMGVYVGQRFLLYHYETMLPDCSIAIKMFPDFEAFCDEYALSIQEGSLPNTDALQDLVGMEVFAYQSKII